MKRLLQRCICGSLALLFFASFGTLVPIGVGPATALEREYAGTPGHYVVAYYFHGNSRCATCRNLEQLSRQALEEGFPGELESGRLVFRSVNVDLEENRHYIGEFGLYTKSLVVVQMNGDTTVRHKNLTRIWELVREPDAFLAYVREETGAYLQGLDSENGTE
jgi:hypothetical protein